MTQPKLSACVWQAGNETYITPIVGAWAVLPWRYDNKEPLTSQLQAYTLHLHHACVMDFIDTLQLECNHIQEQYTD